MVNQIKLLSKISLCNAFGFNEARYGKDKKKKNRIVMLGFTFAFVGLIIMFYVSVLTLAYVHLGVGEIVPSYLFAVTSLVIFFFTMFKAGSVIFNMQTYERLITLPIKPHVIVISRFFNMYVTDFLMSLLVMLPGTVIYGVLTKPGMSFYIMMALSTFFVPLIPLTVASIIGAVISGMSSKMKHKNIVSTVISIAFVLVIMYFSTFSQSFESFSNNEAFADLSKTLIDGINSAYPPAILFSNALIGGSWSSLLLFFAISIAVFIAFVVAVQHFFVKICTSLNSSTAKRNYVMKEQMQSSPLKSLYIK